MEGPSLKLASEQLRPFKGKIILRVTGNTKVGKERLEGLIVKDIFSWGKHLVFQFDTFAMRVHFMLFGTFEAVVNGRAVTGDYKRAFTPRLKLEFKNGEISMFNCSIKFFEEKAIKKTYDFRADIMSLSWDKNLAYKKTLEHSKGEIADVLLDQSIFAGLGNIIKNEVLFLARINPKTKVKDISTKKLKNLINLAQTFSLQFYKWRKKFVLRKNLIIYQKSLCPVCGGKVKREKTGKGQRFSFYCPTCQRYKAND
jgi:endonuclease-8